MGAALWLGRRPLQHATRRIAEPQRIVARGRRDHLAQQRFGLVALAEAIVCAGEGERDAIGDSPGEERRRRAQPGELGEREVGVAERVERHGVAEVCVGRASAAS